MVHSMSLVLLIWPSQAVCIRPIRVIIRTRIKSFTWIATMWIVVETTSHASECQEPSVLITIAWPWIISIMVATTVSPGTQAMHMEVLTKSITLIVNQYIVLPTNCWANIKCRQLGDTGLDTNIRVVKGIGNLWLVPVIPLPGMISILWSIWIVTM